MRYLSLFSGMETAHIAWHPLGWACAAVAEVDPNACALLRHRLPDVPNLGDVTAITDSTIAKLGRIDVVIGGSPCQDLSVAGKRAGLAGARSNLFHEQLRIFHAARTLCGARWLIWENVPGAFSSNKGRDFAVVVGAMAGCELDVPRDGWGNEGVAVGDNGLVEWAVLDSQWFGVAQRRRRVFAVLDIGDWAGRPPVLLEPESLRGDSAPRREAGQSVAGTLAGGARRSGGYSTDDVGLIAGTLQANGKAAGSITQQDAESGMLIPVAFGGNNTSGPIDVGTALNACASASGRLDFESETFLIESIGFDCKASGLAGFGVGEIASTMRSMGHAVSHQNGGGHLAVAIRTAQTGSNGWGVNTDGVAYTLDSAQQAVASGMAVRRLTPIECERLQGAPDNWTLVPNTKGKPMADGPRYKMLGNSFTATVIRWIGRKIEAAHGYSEQQLQEAA